MEYTPKTRIVNFELSKLELELEPAFFEVCELPLDEGIKAMNKAVATKYTQFSLRIDDVLEKLLSRTSETASSFLDRFNSQLQAESRTALVGYHISTALVTLEEKLTDVDKRDCTNDERYEFLANALFDHVQPSFTRNIDDFCTVNHLFHTKL